MSSKKKTNKNSNNRDRNNANNTKDNFVRVKVQEEVKKEAKKEKIEDTSLSVIEEKELNDLINEDLGIKKKTKKKSHIIVHLFLVLVLITAVGFFGLSLCNREATVSVLVSNLVLTLFSIFFVVIGVTYNRRNKSGLFLCGLLLFGYLAFQIGISLYNMNIVEDFRGKAVSEAIKWADKHDVTITQEYEYSDMIKDYVVISQNI